MSLKDLQTKIGATADGSFGPGTIKAAMAFFKLSPDISLYLDNSPIIFETSQYHLNFDLTKKIIIYNNVQQNI